jgi:hypothetical protein
MHKNTRNKRAGPCKWFGPFIWCYLPEKRFGDREISGITSSKKKYKKINTALIPTEGSTAQGAAYEFTDSGVKNRKVYFYKLEDIDMNGASVLHGPVSAEPRWILGIGK